MLKILKLLVNTCRILFYDLADPRTLNFSLMNPFLVFGIIGIYLMFVLKWGPNFMKNREQFHINKILIVYNIVQIVMSMHIVLKALSLTYVFGGYNIFCEPVNYGNDPKSLEIADRVHTYYLIKVFDLLDTVFFVLRKKNSHITFLHVYHHAGMVAVSWGATKYIPGGNTVFTGFANSIVHIVMYSYYLVVMLKPEYKKNLWWKKYITQVQIIQFCLMTLHWISFLLHPGCGFPKGVAALMLPQNFFMLVLFVDFYYKAYNKPNQKDPRKDSKKDSTKSKRIGFPELFDI